MKDLYLLITVYEGAVSSVKSVDTLEKAREIMKEDVIETLDGVDESVFDEYEKYAAYSWEPDNDEAWVSLCKQYSWRIVPGNDVIAA